MADSITRLFQIIEYMARSGDWVSVRTMARELDISAASAFRTLNSLKETGYVRQNTQDSKYQLTLKISWISAQVLEKVQLRQIALPFMRQLTSETNETTHLAVLDGTEFVYINKVDNSQAMRMRSRIGQRGKMYCTAIGKSMLAFMPESDLESLMPRISFQPSTPKTITDQTKLRSQLIDIRAMGYAIDDEENEVGIRCVGAPIFDHTGRLYGAMSISGWTITMTPDRIPTLTPLLLKTCLRISQELGFRGKE